jgi:3-deoxy-manno-octulosonate cytidylyltransferase (CMP-KDO synthetase)|tara:strand:- start:767 stop:1504 length:738 start_codon:yes stop_codon:yes gene_type:complete
MLKAVIIIPARYNSSRFSGKPLKKILNKEMIIWVAEVCERALGKKLVYVATDDDRIHTKVRKFGFQTVHTSKFCLTGTDRVAEASKKINSKIYINVQGDEPLIKPQDIQSILNAKLKYPNHVICGYTDISMNENPLSKNIPKVVFNEKKELIYMSRSLIPACKEMNLSIKKKYFKQVCIYAFNKFELNKYYSYKRKSTIEKLEDIEILRFFDLNKKIKMIKITSGNIAVDEKDDINKIEKLLKKK